MACYRQPTLQTCMQPHAVLCRLQCQNIAYGMCQQHAKEEAMKPSNGCKAAFMRFRRCNK